MKSMFFCFTVLVMLGWAQLAMGQAIGINTNTPHTSSILDVVSDSRGILIPRLSTSGRLSISNPVTSLLVFDVNDTSFYFFDGDAWQAVNTTADSIWVKGNTYIYNNQWPVGIGTDSVLALLHLHADTTSPYMLISTQYYNSIIGLDETDGTIFIGNTKGGSNRKLLVIDTLGRVGIGIDVPKAKMHLADTNNVEIRLETPRYNVIIGLDETDGTLFVGNDSNNVVKRRVQIDTIGRVGIGNVDPNARLNVEGRIKANELQLHSGSNSYVIALDAQGQPNITRSAVNFIDLYGTNTVSYTTSFVDVPWGGTRFAAPANSCYSHTSNSANVSFLVPGLYKITYSLAVTTTSNPQGSEVEAVLQLKPSAGLFADVPGSRGFIGPGTSSINIAETLTRNFLLQVSNGDVVKLITRRSLGNGTITTVPDACAITIERL